MPPKGSSFKKFDIFAFGNVGEKVGLNNVTKLEGPAKLIEVSILCSFFVTFSCNKQQCFLHTMWRRFSTRNLKAFDCINFMCLSRHFFQQEAKMLSVHDVKTGFSQKPQSIHVKNYFRTIYFPEFLKTGLTKIRAHSTTWQLKAIKFVQRPIKKPISDAEQ